MPGFVQFDPDYLIVLRDSLLSTKPQEGCALLIGERKRSSINKQKTILKIRLIWPCCNIWEPGIFNLNGFSKPTNQINFANLSRKTRFAIDPREQLHAQRWARDRNWTVLGHAHSHPLGEAMPSSIDKEMSFTPGLMVIVNGSGDIGAWWIANDQKFQPLQLTYQNGE